MKNQSGFSLIEVLVGVVVLSIVITLGVGTVAGLRTQLKNVQIRLKSRSNVSALIESIADNVSQYTRLFQILSPSQKQRLMEYDNATIAFDDRGIYAKDGCSDCTGRISYLIEPHPSLPGFSIVTILIHANSSESITYRFITGEI